MLLPGLGGDDQTLLVLAAWLRRIGYRPHTCGFVANLDCSDRALDRAPHEHLLEGDGVVHWQSALVTYGGCIEVTGSHVGLIFTRKTYGAIANALAAPELS